MMTGDQEEWPPIRWIQDYQECLLGKHGEWWRLRADRAVVSGTSYWRRWRDIRVNEFPPTDGRLLELIRTP